MQSSQIQAFATGVGCAREAFLTEAPRYERTPGPQGWGFGLCRSDRSLAGDEEPPLGAHLVTSRLAYAHHGVYVGRGTVVHYAAYAKHWRSGPVEETSLKNFADGRTVWVRRARPTALQCPEIVLRARSRLGENRYRFFSNNCEHLSEWCVNGEHRSPQVEHILTRVRFVLVALRAFKGMLATRRCAERVQGARHS